MATKDTEKKSKAKKKVKKPSVKAVKKEEKKEKEVEKEPKKVQEKKPLEKISGKYTYAVGRRKVAVAQVRLYSAKKGEASVSVNEKEMDRYFGSEPLRRPIDAILKLAQKENNFTVTAKVMGGGLKSQAEAITLGIARGLVSINPEMKKELKDGGYLTRDPRRKERKKPGLKKARRAPQWSKR